MYKIKTNDKIDIACKNYKMAHVSNNIKFNKLDDWLYKESEFFINEISNIKGTYKKYKRGQIVKVDFGINIGSELSYTHFAIVITKNDSIFSDIVTVIPITSKCGTNRIYLGKILHEAFPNSKKYNLNCYGNLSQISSISKKRIFYSKKQYICNNDILNNIDNFLVNLFTK